MPTTLPTVLPNWVSPIASPPGTETLAAMAGGRKHSAVISDIQDTVTTLAGMVGVTNSTVPTALDYIIRHAIPGSAAKLTIPRLINGVAFDGSGDITITGAGDLLAANNLSDLANIATARTNLGLGSAALNNTGDFDAVGLATAAFNAAIAASLQRASNLSDLNNAGTARSNLGLGSLAVLNGAPAGGLTGATLAANVLASSLTSFGNSPAFVTPLLGTPTSGNLANCTFPTLNQNTTGSSASCTGNAVTATALQTARAINGISFDGTAPITITAAAGTLTGGTLAANVLASSLTSLGTLAGLTVTAAPTFSAMTLGQVLFPGAAGLLSSNANLFWDNTNNRLGVGNSIPGLPLDVSGSARVYGLYSAQLTPPAAPVIANVGAAGTVTYSYRVTALNTYGETLGSTAGTTTTGNATLTGSNYNTITWGSTIGAASYNVYRTRAAGGSPTTVGKLGNVLATAALTFNDTGVAATVPNTNFVQSVTVSAGGSGYTNGTYTNQSFTGGGGASGKFSFVVAGNAISSVTVTTAGSGYTSAPTCDFTVAAGAGSGETVVVLVDPTPLGDSTPYSSLGTTPSTTAAFYVSSSPTNTVSGTRYSFLCAMAPNVTQATTAQFIGLSGTVALNGAQNYNANCFGLSFTASQAGTGAASVLIGSSVSVTTTAAGSISTAIGYQSSLSTAAASSTISTGIHFFANTPSFAASSTFTTVNGIRINNQGVAGLVNSAAILIAAQNGSTNNSALVIGQVSVPAGQHNIYSTQGTITVNIPAVEMLATWNAGGVTFTHILGNVTNTASAAASKLIDLQVGGASQFVVRVDGQVTHSDGANMVFGTTNGTQIGTGTTQKIGIYGTAPIAQRAGAAQAAVATTGSTQAAPFGYTTAAQADAIVTLVNELRAWAVVQGWIKGTA